MPRGIVIGHHLNRQLLDGLLRRSVSNKIAWQSHHLALRRIRMARLRVPTHKQSSARLTREPVCKYCSQTCIFQVSYRQL
jgi:hypothetical protein